MASYRMTKTLKNLGLSAKMFSEEQYQEALKQYEEMQKRIVELENSDEWKDKDLPWKQAREEYVDTGETPGIEILMPKFALWGNQIDDWVKLYNKGFYQFETILRKGKNYKNVRENTRFLDECKKRGIDIKEQRKGG